MTAPVKRLRCALYTRKSSEEGLDQAFNTLHAQREACEAYALSQAGEGWKALPTAYDDGGFSGGSMERPALKRLLVDIAAGRIDVVVVYKIDRLTRSLGDFARMVELFDANKVSFVSVTQAFNTTTSMGRLTLNVLLSFAQFEREVTGERIRDKIAASKAKGMWMGGLPPLGYDLPTDPTTRALVVNPSEVETVRLIFATYLELGSVHALMRRLDERGIRSKLKTTRKGRTIGGLPFNRGALFHLLGNKVYRGLIVHGGKDHPGAHLAIVDEAPFQAAQAKLAERARRRRGTPSRVGQALLKGRIFDADGEAMSPTFTHGARGQVYRYYVSASLQQGGGVDPDDRAIRRVAADALEAKIAEVLARLAPAKTKGEPIGQLARVEVHAESLRMLLPIAWLDLIRARLGPGEEATTHTSDAEHLRLVLPIRVSRRGGRTWILGASAERRVGRRDPVLIDALRHAHAALSPSPDGAPMLLEAPANPHHRKRVRLAFLAPELQVLILAGTQPAGLTLDQMSETRLPLLWRDQIRLAAAL